MSRLLISNKKEEERMLGLLAVLKGAEKQPDETVEIKKSSVHELADLVEMLLEAKPIVLEEDLSPARAGEIAQISRPVIMQLLKSGKLKGYPVGTQVRIKKESLLKYLEDREAFAEAMADMDRNGLG